MTKERAIDSTIANILSDLDVQIFEKDITLSWVTADKLTDVLREHLSGLFNDGYYF
jgi:hypothetical protein